MKLLAPSITGETLHYTLSTTYSSFQHWFKLMLKDMPYMRERLSALKTLAANAGDPDFNPYELILFLTIARGRYFSTGQNFLISAEAEKDPAWYGSCPSGLWASGLILDEFHEVNIFRPEVQSIEKEHGIGFVLLEFSGSPPKEIDAPFPDINDYVRINFPAILMPERMLEVMANNNLLERFRKTYGKILQATNHDVFHNITNAISLRSEFSKWRDIQYFSDILGSVRTPPEITVGKREEDILLATNGQVFRLLKNSGKGRFVPDFFKSIEDAKQLLAEVSRLDKKTHAGMKDLLTYMVSNYVKRKHLAGPLERLGKIVRAEDAGHIDMTIFDEKSRKQITCPEFFCRIAKIAKEDMQNFMSPESLAQLRNFTDKLAASALRNYRQADLAAKSDIRFR